MKIETDFFKSVNAEETPKDGWIVLSAPRAQHAIHRAVPAASKDRTRAHVNCVLLESDGTTLKAVTTDGHRVHLAQEKTASAPFRVLVPLDAARVLDVALADAHDFAIAFAPPAMFLRIDGDFFWTKPVDAEFPPYEQVIPMGPANYAIVDRAALRRAVVLATRVDSRAYKMCQVDVDINRRIMVRSAGGVLPFETECRDAFEQLSAMRFAASARYLITALRAVETPRARICLQAGEKLSPITICPVDADGNSDDSLMAIVMPVRT